MASGKIATIKLTLLPNWTRDGVDAWRVETITDSLEYAPGSYLDRVQVKELCAHRGWKVSIGVERR